MTALTPAVFHVLLALAAGDRHGYAIMQEVADHTDGELRLGAGTLYGTIQRLLDLGWVSEVSGPSARSARDERRRYYRLTTSGRQALNAEIARLETIVRVARRVSKPAKS
jgi:DNA-binding PadR family transcriptional regulator